MSAAPEYAPIHVTKGTVEEHVQGFGMKKNAAYAPSAVNTVAKGGQSRPEEHGYTALCKSTTTMYLCLNDHALSGYCI